ncbi:hypothetical protein EPI10_001129 [Gossypium australe]|uniref:Uncharacterized protein n=1 Tax=Gossypium australe TaxID=47621 RepID=A0A5B6V9Y3_9ROSI|nr:hypothetical protein EPI10_001129 [Gossypium australe]
MPNRRFRFEAWWVVEESFEPEVKWVWLSTLGNLLHKLEELLMAKERDDENLVELIDTKIQLNLEIEKDERY